MNDIIIDSNFLLGLVDERDKWHLQAVNTKSELRKRKWAVIFFDCVLTETVSALAKRLEEKNRAHEFGRLLAALQEHVPEERITWVYPQIKLFYADAMDLMAAHQGRLNFHDALIALAAREMKILYIASFDKDFDEIDWLKRIQDEGSLD
jgi:predicted nucleic acid-binding protein